MVGGRAKIAVWKFASCDGCQLSLLDGIDELLELGQHLEIAYFLEASSRTVEGPYDLSLVEGSITTDVDAKRIREIRACSRRLVVIGACATAGGIQALRDSENIDAFKAASYPQQQQITCLPRSSAIGEHVSVDFEIRGCPVLPQQVREVVISLLSGRNPIVATDSVCTECKRSGQPCIMVTTGTPCLGPVTQAGCGAICPRHRRGCYGCYGPAETANTKALVAQWTALGQSAASASNALRSFNAGAPAFQVMSTAEDG